jgi:hypothetical protein
LFIKNPRMTAANRLLVRRRKQRNELTSFPDNLWRQRGRQPKESYEFLGTMKKKRTTPGQPSAKTSFYSEQQRERARRVWSGAKKARYSDRRNPASPGRKG